MAGKELKPLTIEEAAQVNLRDFPPGPMLSPAQSACSQTLLEKYISPDMQVTYTSFLYNAGSPDGKLLAFKVGLQLNLYNVIGGKCAFMRTLPYDSLPTSLSFNSRGNLLAAGYYGGEIVIWDIEHRKKQHVIRPSVTPSGITEDASARLLALSPDGRFLATSSDRRTIRLWDVVNESLIGQLESTQEEQDFDELKAISFDPLGRKLVVVGRDRVIIWDASPESWARRALAAAPR
ncbi:MAG TPA: hypothetical protein DC054_00955 [Blastocatellia bacterium]|nr:hypothetical protein [Blastocatellia bacterium]